VFAGKAAIIDVPLFSCRGGRSVGMLHRAQPPDFLYVAPPMIACAAFSKESRMRLANANKPNRNQGNSVSSAFFWAEIPTIISSRSADPLFTKECDSLKRMGTPSPLWMAAVSLFTCTWPSPLST
jgi:hypothetical protein